MEIAINEAKLKLSELIERAGKGEQIVLTRHRKPVAVIKPIAGLTNPIERQVALRQISGRAQNKVSAGKPAAEADNFLYDSEGLPS